MHVSSESPKEPFETFFDDCRQDQEQTQRELKEIDLLIQQTTAEVERLAQRNTQVTNRLRQIELNLDTAPRQDIKDAYAAVLDTQQRLFTMRGQLEKLQSNQRNLERYLDLLRTIVDMAAETDRSQRAAEEAEGSTQPLVVRIIEAQERERLRLSRQMHDGPAQSLTNLILQAEICERLFETDTDRARAELANLRNAVAGTFQTVKGFILNLRPMMLDDLGVIPTLKRYVDSFSDNNGVATHLMVTGKERRLESHKEVTIFRLIQQLLNNAVEYSQATHIQINLDMGDDALRVSVEDNGSGFDLSELSESTEADQMGLMTMRERVDMLGGEIHFDSGPGRGTKVSFELSAS
ncbi:MAG TPA: sensor histidine kinase [Chloroflexi bacterium]|nr:sensor histidine kinase [Chloroflexota bacterium]